MVPAVGRAVARRLRRRARVDPRSATARSTTIWLHPLRPTETLREYSFLDNPRTPKGAVAAESLRGGAPGDRHAEVGRLKAISAPVLNVTNLATIDVLNDDYLTPEQAKAFRSKFGYAGGSWCCAPSEEKGAPRNAHFSLMRA